MTCWIRDGYFREIAANYFEVSSRIREMVTFSHLNLAEDTYPSLQNNTKAMDVIFCRDVLRYFAPEQAGCIIRRFYRALYILPWAIPGYITALTWRNMYDQRFGAVNLFLARVNEVFGTSLPTDTSWPTGSPTTT